MSTDFNINISDYSIDELFSLLNINVLSTSNYNDITTQIEENSNKFIKQFELMNKPEIVDFFQNVKSSLLGNQKLLSTSAQNVITYQNLYTGENNLKKYGDEMFNQNNGAGNPIHRKTVSKLLNIDSRFRSNYSTTTSSNYNIDLPYPIHNVIEIKLCDLELPSTFYPISNALQNNYFWIHTKDSNDDDTYYYIFLQDRNYYYESLITYINNIFKSLNLPITFSVDLNFNNIGGVGDGSGVTKIGILNQVDVSNNNSAIISGTDIIFIELNFGASQIPSVSTSQEVSKNSEYYQYYIANSNLNYKELLGYVLGYRKVFYTGAEINIDGTLYYTSESVIDLSGPKYLFLVLDDYNKSMNINFLSSSVNGLLPDNIIARISMKGQLFSIQSQNDFSVYSEPRYYYGPVNIIKMHINIIDEYGRNVDLNDKDFSFTVRLTTIYSVT
jgi:hypothetical protein